MWARIMCSAAIVLYLAWCVCTTTPEDARKYSETDIGYEIDLCTWNIDPNETDEN